jgi:hypothetical protein
MSYVEKLTILIETRDTLIYFIEMYKSLGQYHQRAFAEDELAKINKEIDKLQNEGGTGEIQINT